MRRNQAPLFFLIIITGIIMGTLFYIHNDIVLNTAAAETAAVTQVSGQTQETSAEPDTETPSEELVEQESSSAGEEPQGDQSLEFETVAENYFDDALFIGDSRTVGLRKYITLGKGSFYADTGMSIHNIFDKKLLEPTISEEKLSLEEVLTENSYGKIYLMVGINELGRGTADTYYEEYGKVVERIRLLQPEALFFVEGNMNVTKEKSDNDPIFNNVNIGIRNDKIASLADGNTIFYIDINEVITDEEGYLINEYTFDDVHLQAKYYTIWKDFLLAHGIVTEKS